MEGKQLAPCCGLGPKVTDRKCELEIDRVEISVAIPVAFSERRIVVDIVLVFPCGENFDQIRRVKDSVHIDIAYDQWESP